MTEAEFFEKYKIHFESEIDRYYFFIALDTLYLQFTREQALEIVGCYYDHADDITNDIQERMKNSFKNLMDMLQKKLDEQE